jgi:ABC-2 family transporter protein
VIWLAWRQMRTQVLVVFGVLVALGIALALTGPHLVHEFDTIIKPCEAKPNCGGVANFSNSDRFLQSVSLLLLIAPALAGMFWGAPLVAREYENGTYRLVWTQSSSRARWLAAKLGMGALVSMVAVGLLSLMTTWWFSPIDAFSNNSLTPSTFDRRDLVPIAYALFAFAFGATAGLILRRTLPAMAVTLFGFIGLRYVVEDDLRPHFMTPLKLTSGFDPLEPGLTVGGGGLKSSDQVVSQETVSGTGHVLSANGNVGPTSGEVNVSSNGTVTLRGIGKCAGKATNAPAPSGSVSQSFGGPGAQVHVGNAKAGVPSMENLNKIVVPCARHYHLHQISYYQPMNRYWPFQFIESGIFIAAALVLAGLSLWLLRRRTA